MLIILISMEVKYLRQNTYLLKCPLNGYQYSCIDISVTVILQNL